MDVMIIGIAMTSHPAIIDLLGWAAATVSPMPVVLALRRLRLLSQHDLGYLRTRLSWRWLVLVGALQGVLFYAADCLQEGRVLGAPALMQEAAPVLVSVPILMYLGGLLWSAVDAPFLGQVLSSFWAAPVGRSFLAVLVSRMTHTSCGP